MILCLPAMGIERCAYCPAIAYGTCIGTCCCCIIGEPYMPYTGAAIPYIGIIICCCCCGCTPHWFGMLPLLGSMYGIPGEPPKDPPLLCRRCEAGRADALCTRSDPPPTSDTRLPEAELPAERAGLADPEREFEFECALLPPAEDMLPLRPPP